MTAPLVVLRTGLARISQARTRRDDRTLAHCLTSFFLTEGIEFVVLCYVYTVALEDQICT